MKRYSQNSEQDVILEYFKDFKTGTFLSIGENDGETLSNVRALALDGWSGVCVEPSEQAFSNLDLLYLFDGNIFCMNAAIGDCNMITTMYESGSHLNKGDTSLLSTLNKADYEKWKDTTDFKEVETEVYDVETMLRLSPYRKFDLISLDVEGHELIILNQMNLKELECKLIVLEHNGDQLKKQLMMSYCANFGLKKLLLENAENIILAL